MMLRKLLKERQEYAHHTLALQSYSTMVVGNLFGVRVFM